MEQLIFAFLVYLVGCAIAKIMLCLLDIDRTEHDVVYLSWVTVIVLLLIRGR